MSDVVNQGIPLGLFVVFCALSIVSALGVVVLRNPVSSAFALILTFLNVAGIFAMQEAFFIAAVQVIVYAGAIMVLFIFVIMLLNLRGDGASLFDFSRRALFGLAVAGLLGVGLVAGLESVTRDLSAAAPADFGRIATVGTALFSPEGRFLLPFEVVSVLLTVAVIGAVVLAKREI